MRPAFTEGLRRRLLQALPTRCRRGVTALEYGLLAGLIAVALIVGAGTLGNTLNNQFSWGAAAFTYLASQ